MKHILMQTPNSTDTVSLYRHWGPMFPLKRKGLVQLQAMSDDRKHISHWHYYKNNDFAFMCRSAELTDLAFAEQCRKHGRPIWMDIDDNLFEVPDTSDGFQYYSQGKAKDNLRHILKQAKVVTVATPELQKYLKNNEKLDTILIPNALDDDLLMYKQNFNFNNKVVWRGSGSGKEAVDYYAPAILELAEKYKKLDFAFFGFNPYMITRRNKNKNVLWAKAENFEDYIAGLAQYNGSFNFMTHINSIFEKTKSTNGWLEVTLTGGVCLVADIGDWSNLPDNCVFKYKCMDLQSFIDNFNKMIETPHGQLKQMHLNSMNLIENEYLLSIINKKRIKIIEEINGNET